MDVLTVTVVIPVGPVLVVAGLLWSGYMCWLFIDVFREAREIERKFSRMQRESYMEHINWYRVVALMAVGLISVAGGVLLW